MSDELRKRIDQRLAGGEEAGGDQGGTTASVDRRATASTDGRTFARERREIHGRLGAEALPRLAASAARTAGFDFTIAGGRNAQGKDALRVCARGVVEMQCQRCLAPVALPIDVDTELELAETEVEIATAEDDVDRVLATPAMAVASMVEDELLLALPMVARHDTCVAAVAEDDATPSAFAKLGELRRVH